MAFFAVFAAGCDRSRGRAALTGLPDTWAVYWYLCGSDLESNWGLATDDLAEMISVALPDNVEVVIQTGGALRWHCGIDENSIGRYLYRGDELSLLGTLPDASMSEPDTLRDFLAFCNENYPAQRQVVVLWNHGGGSLWGAVFDERYEFAALSLPELRQVFETVPATSGQYEAVGFDACLMATVDVADVLRGHARYMVASADVEPGYGWDYATIMRALARGPSDGGALGKAICDGYYRACEGAGEAYLATLSVVDLDRAGPLIQAYQSMGDEALLLGCQSPLTYFGAFGRAARKAQKYGPNSDNEGYANMVDLYDLVHRAGPELLPTGGPAVLAALDECVVYQVNGPLRRRSGGLACYYNFAADPMWSAAGLASFAALGTNRSFSWFTSYSLTGSFDAAGRAYVRQLARARGFAQPALTRDAFGLVREHLHNVCAAQDENGFALCLAPEDAACVTDVCMRLELILGNGDTVALGVRPCETADWESGIFGGSGRTTWGAIGGALLHMDPIEQADDYALWAVPIVLNGAKNILYVGLRQEAYEILGAREVSYAGMVEKNLRPLAAGDVVQPLLPVFVGIDADGSEIWEEQVFERIVIRPDTLFHEQALDGNLLRVSFVITDCSGHVYTTPPIDMGGVV